MCSSQVRIAAAFYDTATGETVTVQDASRTHKRKHHINTLAMQVRGVGPGAVGGALWLCASDPSIV